jgi:hypothetical protein
MARRSFIQIDGVLYEKGVDVMPDDGGNNGPVVLPDLPDFVSPIDGSVVSGRKGMRDHCARHGVVPTADLAGLPPKPSVMPYELPKSERQETREFIAHQLDRRRK